MKLYSIYDTRAGAIAGGVHVFRHHAQAIRFFADMCADGKTMISRHPADFHLVCIADVDEEIPLVFAYPHPEIVVTGDQMIAEMASSSGAPNAQS